MVNCIVFCVLFIILFIDNYFVEVVYNILQDIIQSHVDKIEMFVDGTLHALLSHCHHQAVSDASTAALLLCHACS